MNTLCDLHCHMLPGIDDGAQTPEEARALLEASAGQGVSRLVFTPHFYPERMTAEEFLRDREAAVQTLRPYAEGLGIAFRVGAEIQITPFLAELPLEKFFVRNRVVNLNRGELLKEIRIPKPTSFRTAADFKKLGKRKGHVIATLNLAVVLELAPRPIRFYESEKLLVDCPAEGPELLCALEQIRACLLTEIEPRDSLRGSREYRMRTAPALLSDMILEACGRGGAE